MNPPACSEDFALPDFQLLFESAPSLYLVLSPDLSIVAVSDAYLAATMTQRARILGRNLFEVFPDNPDDPDATGTANLLASLDRVLRSGQADTMAVQRYDIRRPPNEGGGFVERYWSPTNAPVLGPDGHLKYIIHRVKDVTDFILLERQREAQQREAGEMARHNEAMRLEIAQRGQELQKVNDQLRLLQRELEARVEERTEALRREHASLEESEQRYRLLFERNPHPMWVYDNETLAFLTVNPAAIQLYGYSEAEFLGLTLRDIRPPEEIPAMLQSVAAAPAAEQSGTWRHRRKDGTLLDVDVLSHAITYAGRRARLVLALDVTARKQAEEERRATLDELQALIAASPQAIVSVDSGRRVRSWSTSAEQLFGWRADEVIDRLLPTIPPEVAAEASEQHARSLSGEVVVDFRTVRLRKDGTRIPVSLSHAPLHDVQGNLTGTVVIYSDITERLRSEDDARARAQAEAASRAKSQFLANMSHELRTPLNAIIGFSELLEDQVAGTLSERQQRYVGNIRSSGRHLLDVVNDILDLAKIEAGRLTLDAVAFEPLAATREVRRIVEPLALGKRLELLLEAPATLPSIVADRAKFKQVLYNLLSNAIKFTREEGRVTLRARMQADPEAGAPGWLVLEVEDSGIGIRPEDQARIFLEFEQVDSSYARAQQGTGLGLALTRKLVELHGGSIAVSSEVGRGSTFTVRLPVVPPSLRQRVSPEPGSPGETDNRPMVLVVEDDPVSSELLTHYLVSHGYAVAHATSAAEAVALAREIRPVAITLDILLPDRDGMEVLAELRTLAETEEIPVIVVSITDDQERGRNLGVSEWLVKPVNRDRFLAAVARAAPPSQPGEPLTILVIDDHRETVDLLADTIERRGWRALRAYGGVEGLRAAVDQQPDAIVLDLIMPDLSGFEVARRLQAMPDTRTIPVLVFTFRDLAAEELASLPGQVQQVLSKSATEELLEALNRLAPRADGPGGGL
ncbi:MAG: PAS domain S-box protein [Gemmatimonadales bacterium]